MKHLYLLEWKNLQVAACLLFVFNMGCYHSAEKPLASLCLSTGTAENGYLMRILYSRNADSISACAAADFRAGKYYLFTTTLPGGGKFNKYLKSYAKQHYGITMIHCGCQNHLGAFYYNTAMEALLKMKPFDTVYLEAKGRFNKSVSIDVWSL